MRISHLLFFILLSLCAHAQVQDSTVHWNVGKTDSLRLKRAGKVDSVYKKVQRLKSAQLNVDSLFLINKFDSTQLTKPSKLDRTNQRSLSSASISSRLDSLSQQAPYRYVDSAQQEIGRVKQRLSDPAQKVQASVNEKLTFIKSESGERGVMPDNLDITPKVPSTTLPSESLSGVSLPSVDVPEKTILPDLKTDLPDLNTSLVKDVKLSEIDQLKVATEKLDQVEVLTEKVGAYQEEITNIKENGLASSKELPKLAEQKIGELDEVSAIQEQAGKMDLPMGEKMDEEAAKEMLKEQVQAEVMKVAKDHFVDKQEALMGGIQKLTDLKAAYESLDSLNVPKRKPNAMKEKPFIERLVPGLSLQIQKSSYWLLDVNPSLAYRIRGHWSAGIGWNQRIGFTKQVSTEEQEMIYGPRIFTEFLWKKGFSLHLEGERMIGVAVPSFSTPKSAEEPKEWMTTVFAGIKKDYKISNRLRGNIQILYMLYDDHYSSPYGIKINTRLGVEYSFKTKK